MMSDQNQSQFALVFTEIHILQLNISIVRTSSPRLDFQEIDVHLFVNLTMVFVFCFGRYRRWRLIQCFWIPMCVLSSCYKKNNSSIQL